MYDRKDAGPPPLDSSAIRRRLQREYVVVSAPPEFDPVSVAGLLDGLVGPDDDADIVIDLHEVERCDTGVVDILREASEWLGRQGASLTLSHPSPEFEAVLAGEAAAAGLCVRRGGRARPLRPSAR
jgi:anti-anti-sigma regulatory factor